MSATCVVIGAGPVGQTCALLLAHWGLAVTLLDQAPHREAVGSKSICQQRDVLDIWARLGAGAITRDGLTWTTARTFYRDREIHSWSFAPTTGTPPFVNISQSHTEAVLDALIDADPRITRRWAHEVTAITQPDPETVHIHLADGTRIAGGYALVCTGAQHRLRDSLGIDFPGSTHPDRFLICDITADLPGRRHERHFHFDPAANPGRQILIHPCPNDTFRIDWQVPSSFDIAADDLDTRIRAVIGDTGYRISWNTVYRFHSRVATALHTGRVFLVGDAAHLFAPFGARGLNSGVADAENAAWKIAAHANGWAPEALLASYHTERHAAALENQHIVDTTMAFLAPGTPAQLQYRQTTLDKAAADPTLAAAIDSGRFAEPFWYTASPLTTPASHRAFTHRPPKGHTPPPAPGTICPDTNLPDGTPLRRHLRGHFTLIAHGPHPRFHALTDAPTRVIDLTRAPELARTLDIGPDEIWLTRPDAHLAGTIAGATHRDIADALRRALGG
ncbi:FAD-dependent monooxygenase [Stackebrandtia nassauensis]|uniref:Monooxygenase FAD-binding protein n=1 Tax=Stackebrandtia nassauensis (strain DSM 44728 / CIP 108903 / NRRL B-16338 / NBRC 102104 / LLR-40K-21) TaxID=446470 RepID=D3PYK1_STANL|nr:FAD-dependent monooxygenase [Stackebrandtia nassauensis]ADD43434.1 monooxygenase FAD-binding protein [Stackebrandtia nassauensis DSM 44728]